jgi:hypothetical protein
MGRAPEKRARWLLRFAGTDLVRFSPVDREQWGWELAAYIAPPGSPGYFSMPIGGGALAACQEWIAGGVRQLATERRWSLKLDSTPSYVVNLDRGELVPRTPLGNQLRYFKERVLRETVPVLLQRFRLCARGDCRRPFIVRKRQAYCSLRCSQTVRTRRYRADHAEKVRKQRRAAKYPGRNLAPPKWRRRM